MPGLLKRSYDQVEGAADDDAADAARDRKRIALEQVNGTAGPDSGQTNGAYDGAGILPTEVAPDPQLKADAAAAIDQGQGQDIPHVTEGYIPLGRLVDRLAQETYNDFDLLIQELATLQSTQINGYGSVQSVQVNIQKKERIFYYAQNYRTKFIKLLVLSQWSRDSQAVSKLIDLHNWLRVRREEYQNAVAWMAELKRKTSVMSIPAPDLKTTLEVLSTGKAGWISDLGYLPQKPLTRREISSTLRRINTLLRIRLSLHEKIPEEMMDFTIKDGRATFLVKDEFEVALSIADEDPASQLYFIDFKFTFSPPQADVGDGPVRNYLNYELDSILKSDGLKGCYDFLHNFVLTHKLSILRNQAAQMSRGLWSNGIRVEQVHRGLVVQYWTDRPGPKNWIELGVRKRRRKAENAHETDDPHLSLRWHMHGKEVANHGIELDVADLSIERILKAVIGKHTNLIFKETKKSLKQGALYKSGLLSVKHRAHPTESAESHLKVQLTKDATITLTQDPVDGLFYLAPKKAIHVQTEFKLNRLVNPAADVAMQLALLRCNEVLATVNQRTRMRRWLAVHTHRPNEETIRRLFKSKQIRLAFYRVVDWDASWLLAITTGLEGDNWWIVECQDAPRNPTPMDYVTDAYQPLKRSLRVPLTFEQPLIFEPSAKALSVVERTAAAVVSQYVDVRQLASMKVRYNQKKARETGEIEVPTLLIHLPLQPSTMQHSETKLVQSSRLGASTEFAKDWCDDVLRSTFLGLSQSPRHALTFISGKLKRKIPNIERFRSSLDADLAFQPSDGKFTVRLRTSIGRSSIPEAQARLDQLSSLVSFIDITSRHNLDCTRIALDALTFSYAALDRDPIGMSSTLFATITFPPGKPLGLSLPPGNPHLRVVDSLVRDLNHPGHGLNWVIAAMRATLSLLRGFSALEADQTNPDVRVLILSHTGGSFSVRYTGRRIGFSYLVEMKYHGTDGTTIAYMHRFEVKVPIPELLPFVVPSEGEGKHGDTSKDDMGTKSTDSSDKKAEPKRGLSQSERARGAQLKSAWQGLCREHHEARWIGLGSGIAAAIETARACVLHVDAAMREALAAADTAEASPLPESSAAEGDVRDGSKMNGNVAGNSAHANAAAGSGGFANGRGMSLNLGASAAADARAKMAKGQPDGQARHAGGGMGRGKEVITLD